MSNWVLIILVSTYYGHAVTSLPFATEATCAAAIVKIARATKDDNRGKLVMVCTESR